MLISSVPTVKYSPLQGYALAVPIGNKMGQRPKGSGEHSIAGKGGQKRNYLAYDRQGKMHMVKVILLKLQPKAELEGHAHPMIVHVSRRELGRGNLSLPTYHIAR